MSNLKIDRLQLEIIIGNDQARKSLRALEDEARKLKKDLRKVPEGSDEWKRISTRLKDIQLQHDKIIEKLGIEKLTMRELTQRQRELNAIMRNMDPSLKEYKKLKVQLDAVKKRMAQLRGTTLRTNSALSRMANGFNKYSMMFAGFAASITGIIFSFRKAVDVANDFNASVSNLSAMTGLTGKKLDWLTQKAKDFAGSTTEDGIRITQTAKEIVDAYILMGSKRPELLQNKEALAEITEKAIILASAQKMDLNQAVQAVAASINQFNLKAKDSTRIINAMAAGSLKGSAFVQDLTDSLKNTGTVANASNMSLEQTIAMLEILAKKQLLGEEAGTQMRSALLRLKAAQLGYQSGTFNLADALDEMNQKMKGLHSQVDKDAYLMKVFGKRQITAGNIMLQNVEAYKKMTKAVTGTNIAMEQAAKNTDNNQARLDAARTSLNKVTIELGEKLAPALTFSTSAFAHLMRGTIALIKFFNKYKRTIISVAAGITAYTIVVNAAAIKQYIYTTATRIATFATKGFNTAIKSNPLGLFIGLITTALTALITWKGHTKDATDQQADFNTELEKTGKLLGSQIYGDILDSLFGKDFEGTAEDRLNKINEILKKKALTLSKTQLEAVRQYLEEQIADMNRILANVPNMDKDLQATTLEIYKPSLESMKRSMAIVNHELDKFKEKAKGVGQTVAGDWEKEFAEWQKSRQKYWEKRKAYEQKQNEIKNKALKEDDEEDNNDEAAYLVGKYRETYQGRLDLLNLYHQEGVISTAEYNDKLLELEKEKNQQMKQMQDDLQAYKNQVIQQGIDASFQLLDMAAMANYNKKRKELDAEKNLQYKALQDELNRKLISNEQYNARKDAIDQQYATKEAKLRHKEAEFEKQMEAMKVAIKTAETIFMIKAQAAVMLANPLTAPLAALALAQIPWILASSALELALIEAAPIPQYARGNYAQITGADDGKTYTAKVVGPDHPSGLFNNPTYVPGFALFGETQQPELVFNSADTQRILNTPALLNALNATLGVSQMASGNAREIIRENNTVQTFTDPELLAVMVEIRNYVKQKPEAVLIANEDYIRTHEKVKKEYDDFQENMN